jgi:hypothetical protein
MALDIIKSVDIIETMENYISSVRPKPEIRHQIDLNYEIQDQSIILNEVRPSWNNPNESTTSGYARATFIKSKNIWKIYWKRANNKWYLYDPCPYVGLLKDFLKIVDEDKHGCFKG